MKQRIIGRRLAELSESEIDQVGGGDGDWTWTTVSTNIGPNGDTEQQRDRLQNDGGI